MAEPAVPQARLAFTPEAVDAFGQGVGADALACNSFLAAALAAGDRLAAGDELLVNGVWQTTMRDVDGVSTRVVGNYFSGVEWSHNDPDQAGLTPDQRSARLFVLGLRGTLEDLATARGLPADVMPRDAGAWFALPVAALILVVGVVAAWVGDRAVTTSAETRQLQIRVAAGADALAQRLGEQRRTGTTIAPSPIESAGLAAAEPRARSVWSEIAGGAGMAVGGGALLLLGAGALWLLTRKKG